MVAAAIGLAAWLVVATREDGARPPPDPSDATRAPDAVVGDARELVGSRASEREALAEAAGPVAKRLRVEVVDLARAPIAHASVLALVPRRDDELAGVTGADGTVEIEHVAGVYACRATAEGFASETARLVDVATPLVIALERASSLSGIVLETGAPRAGAIVLALDSADMVALEELEDVAPSVASPHDDRSAPVPCSARATTGADGRFELTGLAPRRRYTLVAVADDAFARATERGLRPPRANVELVLHPVFAADVRFVDEQGAPVLVEPALRSSDSFTFLPRFEAPEWEPIDGALVRLVSREPLDRLGLTSRSLLVMTSSDPAARDERIGPFEIGRKLPGYEPATFVVFARPTHERTFARETHVLRASGERRGDVRVRLRLATPDSGATVVDGGYTLQLDRADGRRFEWLVEPTNGDHVLHHIPFGAYEARVLPRNVSAPSDAFSARSIQVGEHEALVTADFTQLGRISVTIERAPGIAYDGPATLRIGRDLGTTPKRLAMGEPIRFRHRPYVIDALAPGDYVVWVHDPLVRDGERWEPMTPVVGNELARCAFVVEQ